MAINDVKTAIDELRRLDSEFKIFGAKSHRYENQIATWKDIEAFEDLHEFELPLEYKEYLSVISNGGPGPFYGINGLDDHSYLESAEIAPDLTQPFPHSKGWNKDATFFDQWTSAQEIEDEQTIEKLELDYWDPKWSNGSIQICEYGCASRFLLVVVGADRGSIWFDRTADWCGIEPVIISDTPTDEWMTTSRDAIERVSLLEWIHTWATYSIKELERSK